MWVLTFPITEHSAIDLNGKLVTAHPDQYAWHVRVCPSVRDSKEVHSAGSRQCSRYLEWTSEVLPLGLYIWCQVIMVQVNTQKRTADCASEWTDLSYKSMCTRNTFHFFVTRFPVHISILLGVAEINLSRFGVFLLLPPVLCPKSRGTEATPRGICCGFVATELSFFVLGLQWSVCASESPFSKPWGFFMCHHLQLLPCDLQALGVILGLTCHAGGEGLDICIRPVLPCPALAPGALPEEVAQLLSVLRFCRSIRCSFIALSLWAYLVEFRLFSYRPAKSKHLIV